MNFIKISKLKLIIILFFWLIFLPNSPYIITDFIHLQYSKPTLVWLDILLLFTFSLTGILLAIISMSDVYQIIKTKWNLKFANFFLISVTFLCGFGIYLGRFLRLNSWNIFTTPITVIKRIILSLNDIKTWLITIVFGLLLLLFFKIYKSFEIRNNAS